MNLVNWANASNPEESLGCYKIKSYIVISAYSIPGFRRQNWFLFFIYKNHINDIQTKLGMGGASLFKRITLSSIFQTVLDFSTNIWIIFHFYGQRNPYSDNQLDNLE